MLPALCLLLSTSLKADPVAVKAEQSVWVYSHASSGGTDEFLRIWGMDGSAVPDKSGDAENYSFGYLRFDVSSLKAGAPTKATLILHSFAPAGFNQDQVKSLPLQARPLVGEFEASKWAYGMIDTIIPAAGKDVFGTGVIKGDFASEKSMEIDIDLLKGNAGFAAALSKALADPKHRLYLALTSSLAPGQDGSGSGIYKVYSAATKDPKMIPEIDLEY